MAGSLAHTNLWFGDLWVVCALDCLFRFCWRVACGLIIIGKEKLDALSKSDLKQKKQQVVMTLQSQMKAIAEHSVQVQVLQEEHESTLGAAKQEHVQATKALEEQIANISEATATEHEQDLLQLTQEVTEEMNELNAANDAKVRLKPRDVCQ